MKSLAKYIAEAEQQFAQLAEDQKQQRLAKIFGEGVAEVSLNEGQYEMMMRNGQVKKFIAKNDADAKRIAKGHGAKSVIKLKGGVPAGKVTEQGVAEGEMEESALQAYLGKKKYGKEGMSALQKAGREGASKETMAKIRAKHDKTDESISESRLLDESGHTLEHILNRFKHEVRNFQENGYLEDDLYDALFDYYMESGEMPYGVAKARTGDPIAWISGRLEKHLGTNEALSGPKLAPDVDPLDIPAYKRVGGRHGGLARLEPEEPVGKPRPETIPAVARKAAGKDFPAKLDQVFDKSDRLSDLETLRKMAGLPPRV